MVKITTRDEDMEEYCSGNSVDGGPCCPVHEGKATGAWGTNFFQSEHDYAIIEEFNREAGLVELEKALKGKDYKAVPPIPIGHSWLMLKLGRARLYGKKASTTLMASVSPEEKRQLNYSVYAEFCSDVTVVREHLDAGPLTKMLEDKERKMLSADTAAANSPGRAGPGYDFVLLVACAMSLGCTIPQHAKDLVRKVYECVGLMDKAWASMAFALNGSDKIDYIKPYEDGTPYDFSFGLFPLDLSTALLMTDLVAQNDTPNSTATVSVNKPSPGTNAATIKSTEPLEELREAFAKSRSNANVCGGCGEIKGKDGTNLLECGGCRKHRYCSKACQKHHWKVSHKEFCKMAAQAEEQNVKPGNADAVSAKEQEVLKAPMNTAVEDAD